MTLIVDSAPPARKPDQAYNDGITRTLTCPVVHL
jgi:hypothetical protein